MKMQLRGIALILFAILMTLTFGDTSVFDLDFDWSLPSALLGAVGCALTFWKKKEVQNDDEN